MSPATVRRRDGVEEEMPTLPEVRIVKRFAPVEDATENGFTPAVPWTRKVDVEVVAFTPETVPLSRKSPVERDDAPVQRARYPSVPVPERLPDPHALPVPTTTPVEVTWRHWVEPVMPVIASEDEVAAPSDEDAAVMLFVVYMSPCTVRRREGVEDPMPTLPPFMMVKSDEDALLRKFARRVDVAVSLPQTVRRVESVEVPSEVNPDEVAFT
jgi:hypothetical protein